MRQSRGLSLSKVADATGISASFLSLVENGRSDITIGRLTRLVGFFGISVSDLIPGPNGDDPDVVHSEGVRQLHSPSEGIDVFLLASSTTRTMMPMLLVFGPGAGLVEPGRHAGEEFVHVLDGRLCLEVNGVDARFLEAGDSAYYRSDSPHLFRNASEDEELRLICVNSPPPL